ncbi:MAG: hypothetical protein ACRELB_27135 [Polyangiaceae bacterium]
MVAALVARDDLGWEHDLGEAAAEPGGDVRDARLGEQLLELDWAVQRWARVPRVCASIATSAGFLFASLALLQGLAVPAGPGSVGVRQTLFDALDALALGLAGTAFCVAVHLRARRAAPARVAAAQRLVGELSGAPGGGRGS